MNKHRAWSLNRRTRSRGRHSKSCSATRPLRRSRVELLEPRLVLAAPSLAAISDVVLYSGAPLHIGLDGSDADNDALTYEVASDNAELSASVLEGNRSMRISVEGLGDMVFELFEQRAPRTTSRIIELAESGFYDGLTFHRVANYQDGSPFVIQGGDPNGDGTGGSGTDFDDEFHPQLQHTSVGVLSMAKSSDDTNDSQFFVTGAATRHLDFNHSVFGRLTEGEDVRSTIQAADGNNDGSPDSTIRMNEVDIFVDEENGVLMLSAPEGYSGEADVTVTVSDGNGGSAQQTFHVTVLPDQSNANPYLLSIADIYTTVDTPVSFNIPAHDIEGDVIFHSGLVYPENSNIALEVGEVDGAAIVRPSNGEIGVHGVYVAVRAVDGNSWDTQAVPLFIRPSAPTGITLLSSTDSGPSDTDGVTNFDNSPGRGLRFRVHGVVRDAQVTIYADDQEIGSATVTTDDGSVVVVTDGDFSLNDGDHHITAVQTLVDQQVDIGNRDDTVDLASDESDPVTITVDTEAPQFTSDPVVGAAQGVRYEYDAQTDGETDGEVVYRLDQSPAGMLIDDETGEITWTPSASQSGPETVIVRATDLGGNYVTQEFDVTINQAPEIDPIEDQLITEGEQLLFKVNATDDDQPIRFSLGADTPEGASIDETAGLFRWTPTEAQGFGVYDITVLVTDNVGVVSRKSFSIFVGEENEAPVVGEIADRTIDEGQLLEFDVTATDVDLPEQDLMYRLADGAPAGATIDATSGRFHWRPDEQQGNETHEISVEVADSFGAVSSQTFHVTVDEVDSPPVFADPGQVFAVPGSPFAIDIEAWDPDIPSNSVVVELVDDGGVALAFDPQTGSLTWDVPAGQPLDTVSVVVRATEIVGSEPVGLSTTSTLDIQVIDFRMALVDSPVRAAGAQGSNLNTTTLAELLQLERSSLVDTILNSTFDSLDLFVELAADTGGGDSILLAEQPDRGPIEALDGPATPEKQSSGRRSTEGANRQSRGSNPAANDAVMRSLLDRTEELAAWLVRLAAEIPAEANAGPRPV